MTPPVPRSPRASRPGLDTEDLAIRFVNTVAWRLRDPAEQRLSSPCALLDWLLANKVGAPNEIKAIARGWKKRPNVAVATYETAIRLREATYGVLTARIRNEEPSLNTLVLFNAVLSQPNPTLRLDRMSGELLWRSRSPEGHGTDLLMPIAFSAVELMTGVRAARVRQCQDDRGCGWLFVDESRAQNRRWCSMGDCGNRAKAHRHYERVRVRHGV
jgi:predicted RNA-binding Zn ribbon-like protein